MSTARLLTALYCTASLTAQTVPNPCGALVPGSPIAAVNSAAPQVLSLGSTNTVQIEILGHSENRGYHTFLQSMLNAAPPLPGVAFVVTNRWIGGHQAYRWATPGTQGHQAIANMLATRQHPTIVLGLFSNNVTFPIQTPAPGNPNFDTFVTNLIDIADHCYDNGAGAAMVYFSSHRYKPANVLPCFHERAAVEHLVGTVAAASNRDWIKAGPEQHDLHWCCHPACYAPDNAHTNAQGDALMAEAWYNLLWRELRGCSTIPLGAGTQGSAAIPTLSPDGGLPILGNQAFGVRFADGPPNVLVVHGVGGAATSSPLLVQPFATLIGVTDGQGEHTWTFGLPSDPSFHGLPLVAQAGVLDGAGTFFGFALTQGLRITLCQ